MALCGAGRVWGADTTYSSDASESNLTVAAGDTITIEAGATLTLTNEFTNAGTIINYGTIKADKISSNTGTITNSGTITVINNIITSGTITNSGTITAGTSITNSGTIYNSGSISSGNGGITNTGTITNTGSLYGGTGGVSNSGSGTIDNDGGSVGGYSISYTPTPAAGKTTTVTVSSTTTFSELYLVCTVTNGTATTGESYTVNGTACSASQNVSITSISPTHSGSLYSTTFDIVYPATIDTGDGFSVTVYESNAMKTTIGTVSYTASSESTDYYWAGGTDTSWSTAENWVTTTGGSTEHSTPPSKTSDIFITTTGLSNYPVSASYVSVSSITMTAGLLSLTGGVTTTGDLSLGGTSVTLGGTVTAGGTLTVSSSTVTLGAATEFKNDVVLGGDVSFETAGYALSFDGRVNGTHALSIGGDGAVTFAGTVGTTTALSSFTSGTGTITCTGGRIKTSGNQTYNGPLTGPSSGVLELRSDGTVSQSSTGVITADKLILTPTTTGKGTFSLVAANNKITTIAAGNTALVPLAVSVTNAQALVVGSLTSVATSNSTYNGIYASGTISLTSTSGMTLTKDVISTGGTVELNGDATLNATTIEIKGTPITVTGMLTVGDGASTTVAQLVGNISASSIVINANATMGAGSASTDAYTLSVGGDWTNSGTFTAQSSTVTFTGTSGHTLTTNSQPFYNMSVANASDTLTLASGAGTVIATGNVDFNGCTLTDNGNTITFSGTGDETLVPPSSASTITELIINKSSGTFAVNTNALKTAKLTLTKAGGMTFNTGVTVSGTAASSLSDSAGAGAITFNGKVDAAGAVVFATTGTLTLGNDGTADVCTFTNGVSHTAGVTVLACALVTTNSAVTFGSTSDGVTVAKDTSVSTGSGIISFAGAVTSSVNALTLASAATSSPAVLFDSTVGTSSAYLGAIKSTGTGSVQFSGAVYAASVAVSGAAAINGGAINTTGVQTYTGAVTLGADTSLTAYSSGTSGSDITFGSTLTGTVSTRTLTITKANLVLKDAVTDVSSITFTSADTVAQTFTTNGQSVQSLALAALASGGSTVTVVGNLTATVAVTVEKNRTLDLATKNSAFSTVTLSNSGTIGNDGGSGTFSVTGDTTNTGTITSGSSGITFSGAFTGTGGTLNGNSVAAAIIFKGASVLAGTYTAKESPVSFTYAGPVSFTPGDGSTYAAITIGDGTNTTAVTLAGEIPTSSALTISANATLDTSSYAVTCTGSIIITGTFTVGSGIITLYGSFQNSGTFNCGAGTIKITDDATTPESSITGINTFNNLTIDVSSDTSSKTIKFPAGSGNVQTVQGKFTVVGNSAANEVILTSAATTPSASDNTTWWYINVPDGANETASSMTVAVSYADVRYAYSEKDISSCVSSSTDYTSGGYTTYHWFAAHAYYWGGTASTSWQDANWYTDDTFATAVSSPLSTDETADIVIAAGTATDAKYQLTFTTAEYAVSVKSFTINSGCRVDIASYPITAVNSITNNGTIALTGASTNVLNVTSGTITHATDSTIEYYGSSAVAVASTAPYTNLGLSGSKFNNLVINTNNNNFTFADGVALAVSGTTASNASAIITTAAQTYTGEVTLTCDTVFNANSGTSQITLLSDVTSAAANKNIEFNGGVVLANTVPSTGITISTGTGTIVFDRTVTGSGQKCTVVSSSTTSPAVNFMSTAGSSTGYLGALISSGSGTVQFKDTVYAASIAITGGSIINATLVRTTGTQTYSGAAVVSHGSLVTMTAYDTAASTITFVSTLTGDSHDISFGESATPSNVVFSLTVKTLGALTVCGTADFKGEVGSATTSGDMVGSITISETTTVQTDLVATSGSQTYTGAVTVESDTVFYANNGAATITLDSNVTSSAANKNIEFNGIVILANSMTSIGVTVSSGTGTIVFDAAVTGAGQKFTVVSTSTTSPAVNFKSTVGSTTGYLGAVTSSGSGTVRFDGNVYAASIDITGATVINADVIRSTGNQTYADAVSVIRAAAVEMTAYGTAASTITFKSTLVGNKYDLTFGSNTTPSNVVFSSTVKTLGALAVYGTADFKGEVGSVSTTADQVSSIKVTGSGTSKLNASLTASGSSVIIDEAAVLESKAVTITAVTAISFTKTLDGSQNLSVTTTGSSSTISFGGAIGSTTALGQSSATDSAITITGGNTCTFSNTVTTNGVITQVTDGSTVVFCNNVTQQISGTKGNTFAGNVTFSPSSSASFTSAQPVVFGDSSADTVTLTQSSTSVVQTITTNANNKAITFNAVTKATNAYSAPLSINAGTGNVEFSASFGAAITTALGALSIVAGNVSIDAAATSCYASSVTVTQSSIYRQHADSSITLNGSFTQNDGSSGSTSSSQVAGTINAASGITFASPTYFDGTASFADSGSSGITFSSDVHIAPASTDSVTMACGTGGAIAVKKNFILYSGTFIPKSDITVTKDFILLGVGSGGSTSHSSYSDEDSVTTITNLFAYSNTGRATGSATGGKTTAAVNGTLTTSFPDSTSTFPTAWTGVFSMTSFAGKKITCAANFYDNGVDLTNTSTWTLSIPANDSEWTYFAEAYNMKVSYCTVAVNTAVTAGGTVAKISAAENCTDGGNNSNGDYAGSSSNHIGWDFTRLAIKKITTVYDDVLYVSFTEPVENSNGEITTALSQILYDGGTKEFAGIYSDSACTTALSAGDTDAFYLKTTVGALYRWNTDATGLSSGATESTDRGRSGVAAAHRSIVPDIAIAKATNAVYQTLRDAAKNRIYNYTGNPSTTAANTSEGARYTGVVDNCAPVLVAVYTGQELHTEYVSATGAASQPEYDAHNFIEFQYSEPVNIGDVSTNSVNLRAEDSFASLSSHGGAITNNSSGITVAGYATIATGAVSSYERTLSGSTYSSSASTTIHSLYRNFSTTAQAFSLDSAQTNRIRIAVAGYADGTVTANGKTYRNWNGYITSSTTPSGVVTRVANTYITDTAAELDGTVIKNQLAVDGDSNHALPTITVDATTSTTSLYGPWDCSRPVFALSIMQTTSTNGDTDQIWANGKTLYKNADGGSQFEIIGTAETTTSLYLDRIEFHLFDNTPDYDYANDDYNWVTKNGWYAKGDTTAPYEYAYDISGGSRSTGSKGNASRTSGGIRRSSLNEATTAFTYKSSSSSTQMTFGTADVLQTATSSLFYYTDDLAKKTNAPDDDSLYFAMYLNAADTSLDLTTTFDITCHSSQCFITDLAGNLIQNTGSGTMNSVDRVVPQFSLNVAAVNKDELYMVFSKKLASSLEKDFTKVSGALEFIKMSSSPTSDSPAVSDLAFASTTPVQVYEDANVTCVKFYLNRAVTLDDIETTWVRVKKPASKQTDPLTGVDAYVTPIVDRFGNYMTYYSCHALSDFAVNAVIPTYAYDLSDDGSGSTVQDATTALNVIHDFSGSGTTDNKLLVGRDIYMQVRLADDSTRALAMFDSSITGSMSDLYNKSTKAGKNIWLPFILPSFNTTANTPQNPAGLAQESADVTDGTLRYYTILDADETDSFGWKNKDVAEFLFKLTDASGNEITIDNDGDQSASTPNIPLYALRLADSNDITSFDLWRIHMVSKTLQRGGVTILNNVINPTNNEETVIQVDADAGRLVVAVMTLDGNVIKYLEHGSVAQGTHYYRWNGKNNAGNSVARGMYFIRVVGEGIDETRKVMVVK